MISANAVTVNEIISDITVKIQDGLNNQKNNKFSISIGSFTGSRLLASKGPKINAQMNTIGTIETRLKIRIYFKRN